MKLNIGYGLVLSLLAMVLVAMVLLSGCTLSESVDTPFERGQAAAYLALLEFDDEGDVEKLMGVRDDISVFLKSGANLETAAISRYSVELSELLGVKPGELRAFFFVMRVELLKENGQMRVRSFLEGARSALDEWLPVGDWAMAPPPMGGV